MNNFSYNNFMIPVITDIVNIDDYPKVDRWYNQFIYTYSDKAKYPAYLYEKIKRGIIVDGYYIFQDIDGDLHRIRKYPDSPSIHEYPDQSEITKMLESMSI